MITYPVKGITFFVIIEIDQNHCCWLREKQPNIDLFLRSEDQYILEYYREF